MTEHLDPDRLLASEAVISFVAWLTTRREVTTMSAAHDSAPVCELLRDWLAVNELREPRPNFQRVVVRQPEYPDGAPRTVHGGTGVQGTCDPRECDEECPGPQHDDKRCGWSGLGTCPVCGVDVGRIA